MHHKYLTIILILVSSIHLTKGQEHLIERRKNDRIHSDSDFKIGHLKNGFTYYLKRTFSEGNRIVLHLRIKTGFLQEEKDQLEVAHLIEHLAFRKTEHFESISNYLSSIGLTLGKDINANTGYKSTDYWIAIPSNDRRLLEQCLQIVQDWSGGISLDSNIVNSERAIVAEEYRRAQGYHQRLEDVYIPKFLGRNRYSKRGIGTDQINAVNAIKYERLVDFYESWYRPNLQAIAIVGDIDLPEMEEIVTHYFSNLPPPLNQQKRKEFKVSIGKQNSFLALTDKEIPDLDISIFMKRPGSNKKSVGDIRNQVLNAIFNEIMDNRSKYFARHYDDFLLYARCEQKTGIYTPDAEIDALLTYFKVRPQFIQASFKAIFSELERIKRFGFSELELQSAKDRIAAKQVEWNAPDLKQLANMYMNNFLNSDPIVDLNDEQHIRKSILDNTTLAEVNAFSNQTIRYTKMDILIQSPEKYARLLPEEKKVTRWIKFVNDSILDNYNSSDLSVQKSLDDTFDKNTNPTAAEIKKVDSIGAIFVKLQNGISVILKKVNRSPDSQAEILLHGFRNGGLSKVGTNNAFAASNAVSVVLNEGIGGLNKYELSDYLSFNNIYIDPYINPTMEGIRASCSGDNFEKMISAVYNYFVYPNYDSTAFKQWKRDKISSLENSPINTEKILTDTMMHHLFGYQPSQYIDQNKINELRFKEVYSIYRQIFGNSIGFTFVIAGDFDTNLAISSTVKYLGSLPNCIEIDIPRVNAAITNKNEKKIIYSGIGDKASVQLCFSKEYHFNIATSLKIEVLRTLMSDVLNARLREKESGVYGVSVSVHYSKHSSRSLFYISFNCSPAKVDDLIASVQEEISIIVNYGISSQALDKAVRLTSNTIEQRKLSAEFWLLYLTNQIANEEDLCEILKYPVLFDKITAVDIRQTIREFLDERSLMQFIVLPENEL